MDSLWTPRNITSLDGSSYKATNSSVSQNIFSHLKMFSMQCRKNISVEDNKNRMNIANFINIYISIYRYIYIYISILYMTRMIQNKNDSINSILQHGCGSIAYFRISIFDPVSQTVQMEGSFHLLSYKD